MESGNALKNVEEKERKESAFALSTIEL